MFTIQTVTDLQWDNVEKTTFSCLVKYAEFNEILPVGATPTDAYAHIQELWQRGNAGEYGAIADYVEPPQPEPVVPAPEQPESQGAQTL
jgi:hypothetical protein